VVAGRTGAVAVKKKAEGVDIPKMVLPAGYLMHWNVRRDSMYLTTLASRSHKIIPGRPGNQDGHG
jgi:hypothetical protein